MKKSLSIAALIAAGATAAMADTTIDGRDGFTYAEAVGTYRDNSQLQARGSNSYSGVANTTWRNSTGINLGEDARYTLSFNVSLSGDEPIFDFYLATSSSSILFGTYNDVPGIGFNERGSAGIFTYTTDVTNGDSQPGGHTYALNRYLGDASTSTIHWDESKKVTSIGSTGGTTGNYEYKVVIESFKDTNTADKIVFYYNGNQSSGVYNLDNLGSISPDATLNTGWFTRGNVSVNLSNFKKEIRTETPIPEPSTFGLLAGLGALGLVGTRRRRR